MTTAPRFIMIGGFLGAGKTTTIARLASHFRAEGKNVATGHFLSQVMRRRSAILHR